MKKLLGAFALVLLISFAGCSEQEPEIDDTNVVESATVEPVDTAPMETDTTGTTEMDTPPATATTPPADDDDDGMERPKNHNVDMEGVMHAPGAKESVAKCKACHGKDLQGGRSEVSCYDCHDDVWSGESAS